MRVVITGARGQVGRELARLAPASVEILAVGHEELDIGDPKAVCELIERFRPAAILNAAAYTAVDRAESEPELARRVNAAGPRFLADAARRFGSCRMIQLSTDYVFDGSSPKAYESTDAPHPINTYGLTKREGEQAVLEILGSRGAVVRTAWVYSLYGSNFLLTMLRRMGTGAELRVVNDQIGTPTSAASVAVTVWALVQRPELSGVFHWTDAGQASWYDFAVAIAEDGAERGLFPRGIVVHPIATKDYPTAAKRPAMSLLDTRATVERLHLEPWPWRRRLRQVLSERPHV